MSDEQLKALWKSQPTINTAFTPDVLREEAAAFQRRIGMRNRQEYITCFGINSVFGFYIWAFPAIRLGSLLLIFGSLIALLQFHKRASSCSLPAELAAVDCMTFHRQQLVRQRDALRSLWLWYIGPFVPGLLVFCREVAAELGASFPPAFSLSLNLIVVVVLMLIVLFNLRSAKKLQRQIEQLDREMAAQN